VKFPGFHSGCRYVLAEDDDRSRQQEQSANALLDDTRAAVAGEQHRDDRDQKDRHHDAQLQ
jgi:hypothetical protein